MIFDRNRNADLGRVRHSRLDPHTRFSIGLQNCVNGQTLFPACAQRRFVYLKAFNFCHILIKITFFLQKL